MAALRLPRDRGTAVRGGPAWQLRQWPLWRLPRWLAAFVTAVVLADAAAFSLTVRRLTLRPHDLVLFAALLVCSAVTVELTRRVGENYGFVKDVHAIWELPVAILLPLAYAPLLPAVRFAITQWRVMRVPVHRRAFSAASIGLSYLAAALLFRWLVRLVQPAQAQPARHALLWMSMVAVAAVTMWVVNQALVLTAVKGSDPALRLREVQFAREPLYNDVTELCAAVLATFCMAGSVIAVVFALPFVSLLQRSLRHARLVTDARIDAKTGLLNAATWEREADAEVARAVRTRSPLAVAMLDIDRFKGINDTYGHLLGDQVLKEIAHALRSLLREYDRAGRFGGEEFSLLLPQTRAPDAFRIAERIRSHVAGLSIIASGASGGERVPVTVSIGVAALDAGSKRTLADLLAAADAALYRAKAGGRDQVQMISTTRGLSAVSASRGSQGTVFEARPGLRQASGSRPLPPPALS